MWNQRYVSSGTPEMQFAFVDISQSVNRLITSTQKSCAFWLRLDWMNGTWMNRNVETSWDLCDCDCEISKMRWCQQSYQGPSCGASNKNVSWLVISSEPPARGCLVLCSFRFWFWDLFLLGAEMMSLQGLQLTDLRGSVEQTDHQIADLAGNA